MVFLSIPTTAILASNNAVPGDMMYPVKTTIEKIASLLTSPSYQAHSELEIQLIQRRIEENQKLLLAKGSTEGLKLLVAQAEAATEYILKSNVKSKAKTQAVSRLVEILQESQQKLEEQKQNIASTSTTNTVYVYVKNPTTSQGNSSQEDQDFLEEDFTNLGSINDEIDDANDDIDNILEDLTNTDSSQNAESASGEEEESESASGEEEESESASGEEEESESESESEENQTQTISCNQSCNISGFESGQCKPNQTCTSNYVHNTSGDRFCPNNKVCCCMQYYYY